MIPWIKVPDYLFIYLFSFIFLYKGRSLIQGVGVVSMFPFRLITVKSCWELITVEYKLDCRHSPESSPLILPVFPNSAVAANQAYDNPLSPNIHIQILQTDLYIFP